MVSRGSSVQDSTSDTSTNDTQNWHPMGGWAEKVAADTEHDKREQPWKAALEKTHDQGAEGEDLINLKLPNHVQCGSLAA